MPAVLVKKSMVMKEEMGSAYPEEIKRAGAQLDFFAERRTKVNVDQATIDEDGQDVEKIKAYHV